MNTQADIAGAAGMVYTLRLAPEQIGVVLEALAQAPYGRVAGIIADISEQVKRQNIRASEAPGDETNG